MKASSVAVISMCLFLVYVRMVWPSFNNEESQVHETEDLRSMLNDRWYGLNGHQVSQLHALVDRHVN